MKHRRSIVLGSLVVLVFLATGAGINESIRIDDGEVVDDSLSTLNGRIRIGNGATVRGEAETVNGSIAVGRNALVGDLSTVNGNVDVDESTDVGGKVETVNGEITLARGTSARRVGTVNGRIELNGADVEGDVSTYNGGVHLRDGATVGGDIIVRESGSGRNDRRRPLRIEIEGGSTLRGDVIVEDDDIEVEVHVRDGGSIGGQVKGARLIEG